MTGWGTRETLHAIRALLGPQGIVDDADAAYPYLSDHRQLYRGRAALIARPGSVGEVARLVALCHEARLGIVPHGGNTSYCGGATPDDSGDQVLLSMERLRAIREVDAANFTMTVEAGVILADVHAAAAEQGASFPLSLGSEGSCQIGGNLSTNAGGTAVLRFGSARDLVLGLEVVLADGRVWNGLSKLRKDNAGYDLKQLFLGAEGTLGVITAAVLKLFPAPAASETALAAVRDPAAAVRLLARARSLSGDAVTSFEYLPAFAIELVLAHIPQTIYPLDGTPQQCVLIELSSPARDHALRTQLESLLEAGLESGEVLDAAVAESEEQRRKLWHLRETVPEAQRLSGGSLKHDVSVPVSRVAELLERGSAAAREVAPEVQICAYGHVGDGNLHFNFQAPPGQSLAQLVSAHGPEISARVHALVRELGGSLCAEHGVGQLKRALLTEQRDEVALALMRSLKQALDPHGIMNPGKVL